MKFAEINITQKKGNCLIKDHHSLRISSTLDIKNNTNNFIANLGALSGSYNKNELLTMICNDWIDFVYIEYRK